jgi:hypothetical protein
MTTMSGVFIKGDLLFGLLAIVRRGVLSWVKTLKEEAAQGGPFVAQRAASIAAKRRRKVVGSSTHRRLHFMECC